TSSRPDTKLIKRSQPGVVVRGPPPGAGVLPEPPDPGLDSKTPKFQAMSRPAAMRMTIATTSFTASPCFMALSEGEVDRGLPRGTWAHHNKCPSTCTGPLRRESARPEKVKAPRRIS